MRFAAGASGGSIGDGGPAPLTIEDLTLIYQTVCATEAGADPFAIGEIQHLRKPLEEYVSRQPERHQALMNQQGFVSAEDAEFDLVVVPADPTRGIEEVRKSLKTQIHLHEVPHYNVLAHKWKDLPSAGEFDGQKKKELVLLLEYEIRYRRGCDIHVHWVAESSSQEAASGPF
jgi:hypothetical protein